MIHFYCGQQFRIAQLAVIVRLFALQQLIGVEILLFRKVFVENEPQNIVAELVRIHLSAQFVGDIPKLLFQLPFLIP